MSRININARKRDAALMSCVIDFLNSERISRVPPLQKSIKMGRMYRIVKVNVIIDSVKIFKLSSTLKPSVKLIMERGEK